MRSINANDDYCMYLRRSRVDIDEEQRGAGNTLARHYARLTELAASLGIHIRASAVYREIVSGDTIEERPEMKRLLADVEQGKWAGVLVTEMSRLARGDTVDQGIVANTFLYSDTLIITPQKTYDLRDQSDEEMAEMGLFMSRFEYRQIKRRLIAGRVSSVKQGLYAGSKNPYGYRRYKVPNQRGYSLEIVPEEAAIVRKMYDWFINGSLGGCGSIANRLNELGVPTVKGNDWGECTVRQILKNPTYCGKIWWGHYAQKTVMENGKRVKKRVKVQNPLVVEGIHEAIVSTEIWDAAQLQFKRRSIPPNARNRPMKNPFAGLIRCGICGKAIEYFEVRSNPKASLARCHTKGCPTSSVYMSVVEDAVVAQLGEWVKRFDTPEAAIDQGALVNHGEEVAIAAVEKKIETLKKQLSRARDMLEQEVYSVDDYLERQKELQQRIAEAGAQLEELRRPTEITIEDTIRTNMSQIKSFFDMYDPDASAEVKNKLFKSVIGRIEYFKTERNKRYDNDASRLTLKVYPVMTDTDHS